jgi:hypothetical protein
MIQNEEGKQLGPEPPGHVARSWWARRDFGFRVFVLMCLGWFILGLWWWWATSELIGVGLLAAGGGMALIAIGFSLGYDRLYQDRKSRDSDTDASPPR